MNFILLEGEQILHDGGANHMTNAVNATYGTLYLTNKRIIYQKVSTAKTLLLGVFAQFSNGTQTVFEIKLEDIASISHKLGALYVIFTKDNQFKVGFRSEPTLWVEKIASAIAENTNNTVQKGNNGFTVVDGAAKSSTPTAENALAQLTSAKQKLDLGLITDAEYEQIKSELKQYIM